MTEYTASSTGDNLYDSPLKGFITVSQSSNEPSVLSTIDVSAVSYTHLTLPTTPYV